MTTITNISNGPRDIKTLNKGMQRLEIGESLTAEFERTYLRLLRNGRSFDVTDGEGEAVVQGAAEGEGGATGAGDAPKSLEQLQNDYSNGIEPDNKPDWTRLAESKGIEVKKSWGSNRIKTELEQLP